MNNFDPRNARQLTPKEVENLENQENQENEAGVQRRYDRSTATEYVAPKKGATGFIKDLGLSAAQGAVKVPGSLLAIADAPTTGGKAGKWLEDKGYNFGDQIAQELDKHHTERSKQQRFEFQQAGERADTNTGRVLNKLGYALSNPSMIADTVAQSIPDMVVGGKIGGKLSNKGKRFSAEAGAAVGEGAMMAGHAFENIRQETDDKLLTGEQVGYGVATGAAGALFSWGGNRLAKKLGLADVDTLIAKGLSPQEIAQNIASMPAKSVPKAIIQGALSEGFLEELPQEVSETILGNLATGKEWSEGIDDAIVMAPLAGMAMGGTVGGVGAFSSNRNRSRAQNALQPEEPTENLEGFDPKPDTPPQLDGGMAPQQVQDQYRTETLGRGFKPSQQLGLDPNQGSLSAAAALSVDSGVSPIGLNSIPHEGEYLGPANEVAPSARGFNQNRNSTYGLDPYGNITDVDGRNVPVEPSSAPRLPFKERQEGRAPVYEVDPQGNAMPTSGEAAESRKMRINTSGLKGRHKENQAEQIRPEPTAPADAAKNVWGSLNTYQRAKALKDALGLEGNELNQVAVSNWESLSDEHKAKLTEAMGSEQSSTWTDPNARNQDDSAPVLQNRDRSNAKSLEQMRNIASNPDYFRLGASRDFGNGSPVIEEMNTLQPQYLGKADFAATAEGRRIPVQYAVVEAEQLLSSNDINGNSIPEYAIGVEGMGRAIAGNGRITGLKQAWKNGTTTSYLNEMLDDNSHGINPEVIAGMKNPVLVRMMPKSEITQNIGDESNTGAQLGLTSLERAKTDARRVNWADVRFNEAGTIDVATIAKFVQSMPSSENLVTNGKFSQMAYDRLEAAMMDKAFGNDELTQMQAEPDGESKSIIGALVQSAPTLIKLEGAGIYDIRPLIAEAASVAISARRRGVRLSEHIKQLDMGVSPEVYPILEMMLNDKGAIRSKEYIARQFKNIAELALKEAQSSGEDMFGEVPKRTQEETIKDAMTEVEGDGQLNTSSTEDMGQQGGAESNAEMDEQTGSEQLRPQDGVGAATEGSRPRTEGETEGVSTEDWRTNYLKAAKKARELGIDPRQHKKLADLVKAIDEHTGNTQSEQTGDVIQPTKTTTRKPAKVKPTHFEEDLSADNDFDLTTQTEAELAELEEQRKQREREEARIKAAEEAEQKKIRDAASDRQQAEATVDDFELGQTADEQLTGPGLFSETNTDTPPTKTESYGSKNKLVSTERAEELRNRLKSKLNGRLNSGFDPEILAIGTELAAYHIEAGARKFIDFARAIAKDLDMKPQELRQYLRSWYNGARDMMEDSSVSISGMDSPTIVSQELSNLMSEDATGDSKTKPKEATENESKEDLEAIKNYVLNNIAKHEWRDSLLAKREVIVALNEQGYPLEEVASTLGIPLSEIGSKQYIDQVIEHIFDNQQANSTEGEENVSSTANDMEQGSNNAGSKETTDSLAGNNEGERRRPTRPNEQDSLFDTGESGLPEFSESLFDSSTTTDSDRGNNSANNKGQQGGTTPSTTRSDDNQRGGNLSDNGVPIDTTATEAVSASVRADVPSKLEQQRKAEGTTTKRGDIDNIRQALPYLLEAQQDDVLKIEQRFMKPDGYGMLITNGTGTGKTFSGLGVVKRFANEGKNNILIVVPDDKVASDWVQSGVPLNLEITQLKDTQDAGNGIVVATYANIGANSSLSKRNFDLVVADEAHKLMQSADAKVTNALATVRALTTHPEGAFRMRDMRYPEKISELSDLRSQVNEIKNEIDEAKANRAVALKVEALEKKLEAVENKYFEVGKYLRERLKEVELEFETGQGAKRPRLLALTATPFSYVSSIDWANGYLFDYNEGKKDDGSGAYNEGDNRSKFFMENFGYRMRYNRLTQPEAGVDVSLMERQFNEKLRKSGALSGRTIDVPFDYDRRFILTESKIGQRIDDALQHIQDAGNNTPELKEGYAEISKALKEHFSYLERKYLLEAIKAKAAIPIIKEHLKLGRKVVVFHDYKKGGSGNPFSIIKHFLPGEAEAAYTDFVSNFGDLTDGSALADLESPITVFRKELPETLIVNGDEKKRDILERYKKFQSDDSGPQVMLVQSAKNAGWSGHDTTGKHQRILINLGLPTTPSTSIQQEGRIYRVGQASNAIQRYMNTGTNWERSAFAQTIAQRSGTVENLSMGSQARALKQSFIDAFEDTGDYQPGHEGEGTGGKELDQSLQSIITPYDEAKSYYYGQRKRNSGNKSQEGKDYFATPEPVGLKMVEWLSLNMNESALEPSAGHGAIGRWLPEHSRRTFIEPSNELRSRLSLLVGGQTDRILGGDFESLNIINKFDGVVMNPPFGVGGKLAAEHVGKAMKHLKDGGRIVALIPEGPAANKQFEKLLNNEETKELGIFEIAEFSLPTVTFERAGTKVKTRIIVLEKQLSDEGKQALPQHRRIDFSNAPTIDELFDRLEEVSLPQRTVVPEGGKKNKGANTKAATTKASSESVDGSVTKLTSWDGKHTKTGETLYMVKPNEKLDREQYNEVKNLASKHDGFWDRYTKGFRFNSSEERQAFLDDFNEAPLFSRNASISGGMTKAHVQNIANNLLGGNASQQNVHVVQNYAELPAEVKRAIGMDGTGEGDFNALHYKGKSYIVADAMGSQAEVEAAIFHEHFTHGGLRTLYGKDLANKLDDMLFKSGGIVGVRMQAKKQGIDLSVYESALANNPNISEENKKRILMEELLAHMAHTTGTLRRKLEEVVGAIRQWLRDNGFAELANLGASDIAYVLKQAREAAIEAINGQQAQAQVMFSVQAKRGRYNKNQLDLFEELSDLEGVDPYESTTQRQNTTEKQRQLGRSALSDLFRWLQNSSRTRSDNSKSTDSGVSLIGASIYKDFKAGKPYQLLGKTVNSTADLAALAQVYRDPRFETFRVLYLDENNKVILEEAASTRMPSSVAFAPGTIEGIKEKQEKVGASKVYILHNHPSGNPEPSGADVALTNALNDILGSAFAGHVVIDHNKYAFINKQGDYTIHDAEELAGIDFSSNPEVPHELLENEIHGPSDIAVIGKKIAHSNHPVIVVTKGGLRSKVGLIASIPMELLERFISRSVIEQTQAKAVLRRMIRAGGVGGKLFVVLPKNADLSRYYQWMHDFAQDVVDSNGNSVIHAGNNVSIDDYSAKSISIRNKRITRKETTLREGTQNYNEEPQTETEAFKKWFGDSKVVDEDGKPRIVYHNTNAEFFTFKAGERSGLSGRGIYFSDSPLPQFGERQIKAYVKIENPITRDTELPGMREINSSGIPTKFIDDIFEKFPEFDGIINRSEIVVKSASQIKSATDNDGSFDPSNPDIRFSRTSQARETLFNKAEDFAQKADSWAGRAEEIPSNWTEAQKAAADKFDTFRPKQPFTEKLDAIRNITKDKLAQKIFDQFRPLKAISEKAFKQAHLSRATDGALEAVATRGVPYLKDGAIAVRTDNSGFIGAMTKLGDMEEVRKFLMWVAANRADQLMAEGRENLFTPEDIDAMKAFAGGRLKDGRSRTVAYAEAQKQLREYNKAVLDIAEEAGLVNSESRPTWESEFYIPFYRVLENEDGTASSQYSHSDAKLVRQQVIRQLKGGKEKLGDPLENIMANWSSMLAASMRNMAANEALTQGQTLGISGQVDEQSFAQGERGDTWTLQSGQRVHWHVADPMVMEALESINFNGYNNALMRTAGKFKRALTIGVTISPTFRVRNLIRDTLHAMAVAEVSFNPIANAVNGFKMSGRQTDMMAQLMAGGGAVRFGSFNDGQAGDYVKRLVNLGITDSDILSTPEKLTNALKKFYTEYQEFGDKAETVNRAVVYDRIMKETGNHLEASFAARDVMNFSSMGSAAIIRAMAQTLPFFNARLQGMDKLVRGAAADPRRFWSVVGTIGMASSLLYLMNSDDDEYKAMPDYIRDTYWPIKLGGHWYYVPKPFEVGALGTVVERFTELMFSDGDYKANDLKNSLMSVLINQLELNPMPQVLRPAIEAQFNYDTFRQRPIDSMAMERLLPEERYSANTSSAAIATGKALGVSPQKVEHIVRGYFGWLGTQALNVSDLLGRSLVDRPSSTKWDLSQTNNMFFIGDFVKESGSTPSKYSTRFYDLQRELNQIYASANAARKAGDMERYKELMATPEMKAHPMFKAATSRITKVNQQIKRITSDRNLSSKEKADKLQVLYKRREAIAENVDKQARARGTI